MIEEWLEGLEVALRTQDNAITADPIFIVEERRRFVGVDPDYAEHIGYFCSDCEEVTQAAHPERFARFEAGEFGDDDGDEDQWTRTGYLDRWEFVQPFLTREAAEQYRKDQAHNHRETRVYVDSGYRNPEWRRLRELIGDARALNALRLVRAQAAELQAAGNLLAILHHDGGHHVEKVGFIQACLDAQETYYANVAATAAATYNGPGDSTAALAGGEFSSVVVALADKVGVLANWLDDQTCRAMKSPHASRDWIDDQTKAVAYSRRLEGELRRLANGK